MTPEELKAAESALAQRPEYGWLISTGAQWFNASEVSRGAGVSRNTVRDWCEGGKIPGALFYGPELGWRIPRSGLVEFFYELLSGRSAASQG